MRVAIANAEVGDEQRGEDPTVNCLQYRVAELLGKEAALWFPGGTMCNFVAIKVHTRPADAIIADWMSHIIRAESAGVALGSGVLIEPIVTQRESSRLRDAGSIGTPEDGGVAIRPAAEARVRRTDPQLCRRHVLDAR